jgi:hypothetical protein
MIHHTRDGWQDLGLSLQALYDASDVLFPAVYDYRPGLADAAQMGEHIRRVLAEAAGKPVYVFVGSRHFGRTGPESWIPDAEFVLNAREVLDASWTDVTGLEHQVAGIALWDAYAFAEPGEWAELDARHAHQLQLLHQLLPEAGQEPLITTKPDKAADLDAALARGPPADAALTEPPPLVGNATDHLLPAVDWSSFPRWSSSAASISPG